MPCVAVELGAVDDVGRVVEDLEAMRCLDRQLVGSRNGKRRADPNTKHMA